MVEHGCEVIVKLVDWAGRSAAAGYVRQRRSFHSAAPVVTAASMRPGDRGKEHEKRRLGRHGVDDDDDPAEEGEREENAAMGVGDYGAGGKLPVSSARTMARCVLLG